MEFKITKLSPILAKYKDVVLSVIFAVSAIAVLVLIGFKSFRGISSAKRDVSAARDRLSALSAKRKNLEGIASISGVLDENIALATEALPEKDDISALLSQVQQVSGEAGVALRSLQYTGSQRGSSANAGSAKGGGIKNGLYVQAMVEGTYQQLTKFLELLENARRIVSFDSLRLNTVSKEDLTKLNVSLSATGYFLKPVESAPNSSAGAGADFRSGNLDKVLERLRGYKKYDNIAVQEDIEKETPD